MRITQWQIDDYFGHGPCAPPVFLCSWPALDAGWTSCKLLTLLFLWHNYIKIFTKDTNIFSWSVYCRVITCCFFLPPTTTNTLLLLQNTLKIAPPPSPPQLSKGSLIQNLLPPRLNLSSRNNSSATGGEASQVGIGNWCSTARITKWANARECWSCVRRSKKFNKERKKWSPRAVVFRLSSFRLCLRLHFSSLPTPN